MRKTETCGALRDYLGVKPMASAGRRYIVLRWDDMPALINDTAESIQCRFDEVTEEMALAEGEDASLEGWRANHCRYFARNGGFSKDMMTIWSGSS